MALCTMHAASTQVAGASRGRVATPAAGLRAHRAAAAAAPARRSLASPLPPSPLLPPPPRSPSTAGGGRGSVAARGLFGLGLPEIAVIAGVAALIFGPSKLPELGKGLGKTVKSFQTAAKEFQTELEQAASATDGDEQQQQQQAADKTADDKSA